MPYIRKTEDIHMSEQFKILLEKMKNHSSIARYLLRSRIPLEELADDPINYLSISTTDETKISYLTKSRIESILGGDGSDNVWDSKKRYQCKPGAFVSKIFRDVSSGDVETFSNLFVSMQIENFTFEVVSGHDMRKYYHQNSYAQSSGSLVNSCMKYDYCQPYLELYTENEDVCKMLVMLNSRKELLGRCLLWETNDSLKIMDRVYTISDTRFIHHFHAWAFDNGYLPKSKNTWMDGILFKKGDDIVDIRTYIPLKKSHFEYYPYLDTFRFLDLESNRLYNYIPSGVDLITLCRADGSFDEHMIIQMCAITGDFKCRSDLTYIEEIGYVSPYLCQYSNSLDRHLLKSESFYSYDVNDYIYIDMDRNPKSIREIIKKKNSFENLSMLKTS